ncbi:HlyD family efflux transporter periplasmic adaptor subunit [Roseobacteraceae bacterium S113]
MASLSSSSGLTPASDKTDGASAEQLDGTVTLGRSLWAAFVNAKDERAFLTTWLAVLTDRVAEARCGALLSADMAVGAYVPVAVVPDPRRDMSAFGVIAEKTLRTGRPATSRDGEGNVTLAAVPVRAPARGPGAADAGGIAFIIVLELVEASSEAIQAALRDMYWAAGWLAAQIANGAAETAQDALARAAVALDVLSVASEHRKPAAAAMAIVNEVQTVLRADQVSIGMIVRRRASPRMKLLAMSYSASFKKRSSVAEGIETAMEEAYDQATSVAFPALPATVRAVAVAHAEHIRTSRSAHVLSVPLFDEDGPVGAMTLERRGEDAQFSDDDLRQAEAIAGLIGPVLELKRRNTRWFGGRVVDGAVWLAGILLGPRHLSWKTLALILAALLAAGATVTAPFRIQADAVLRGDEVRAAVAPFQGFVAQANVRAGDRVAEGALLARLADADLRLEALRWRSEVDRLDSQARDAQAQYDRPQVALLEAQINQARAQLALAEAQLARTELRAPIAGTIVSGDLSQSLGAPVQQGEVLFELAPLSRFRVDIYVDERDLRHVLPGASGRLILAGQPSEGLGFETTRITPIAEAREGANTFRVEALLDEASETLRPGMEGVAKIDAGEALLAWTWTRRLIDWTRQTLWTWAP